jgi:hypothetical protein
MLVEADSQQNDEPVVDVEPVKLDSPLSRSPVAPQPVVESKEIADVQMIDAPEAVSDSISFKKPRVPEHGDEFESRQAKVSCSSMQAEAAHSVVMSEVDVAPVERSTNDPKEYWKNLATQTSSASKSEVEGPTAPTSSNKRARSPMKGIVKNAFKAFGTSPATGPSNQQQQQPVDDNTADAKPEEDISPPCSEDSMASSKISGTKVRELVSKITSNSNYASSTSSSQGEGSRSALSKNLQAKKEARLARMAEIRGKVRSTAITCFLCFAVHESLISFVYPLKSKPLASSKAALKPKEYTTTLSSLNSTMISTSTNKKNLAAQMREKAAAAAALRKENIPGNSNQPMITSTGKRNLPTSHYDSVPDSLGATLKQGFLKKAKVAKVASPMDTYEISDREDSDTDDSGESDSETEKQKKKVRESVFQVASSLWIISQYV